MAGFLQSPQSVRWIVLVGDFRGTFHCHPISLRDDLNAPDIGEILHSLLREHVSRVELLVEKILFAQKRCVLTSSSGVLDHGFLEHSGITHKAQLRYGTGNWDQNFHEELTEAMYLPAAASRSKNFIARFPSLAVDFRPDDARVVILGKQRVTGALGVFLAADSIASAMMGTGMGLVNGSVTEGLGLAFGAAVVVVLVKIMIIGRAG